MHQNRTYPTTMNGNIFSYALFSASIVLASLQAYAQPDLQQCAIIEEDTARLACYDKLVQAMADAFALEETDWQATDTPDEIASVGGTVTIAVHSPFTGWTITFDNGQSWKQNGTASFVVNTGDTCTLTPGMINTYLLQCGDRARRIQVTPAEVSSASP